MPYRGKVKKNKITTEKTRSADPPTSTCTQQYKYNPTQTRAYMHRYSYTEPNIQSHTHSSCPLGDVADRPETNLSMVGPTEETLKLINDGIKKENMIKGITEEYYRIG